MKETKILIANTNQNLIDEITKKISKIESIKIIATARDGKEAKEKIKEYKPNVIIIDLILPIIDGIGVIETLEDEYEIPYIVLTAIKINNSIQKLIENKNINLVLEKPLNYNLLIQEIVNNREKIIQNKINSTENNQDNILIGKIAFELRKMHIKRTTKGYQYLSEAIKIKINGEEDKDLMKLLEERFNVKYKLLVANMKYVIKNGYKQSPEEYNKIFNNNKEPHFITFIEKISNKLKENQKIRIE